MNEENETITEKTCVKLKVYYKSNQDRVCSVVVKFEKDFYLKNIPYKENLEDAIIEVFDSYGVWISEKTFIPIHRVLSIEVVECAKKKPQQETAQKAEQKKTHPPQNKRRVSRRTSIPNQNKEASQDGSAGKAKD